MASFLIDQLKRRFIHQKLISSLYIIDEINVAVDGREAIELIKKSNLYGNWPELILLNLDMPIMDGFEFIEKFKEIRYALEHKVRINILSAFSSPKDVKRAMLLDVEDYLVKPLTEKIILEKLMRPSDHAKEKL